ncbi:hypothetical protein [Acetobacter sp.]|uniref:hypothetical protein n=1 Tax=Acetobacter sp. TaxID=440 RepID=UPI0039E971A7
MNSLESHFVCGTWFKSATLRYARGTMRTFYEVIAYYHAMFLDWWFVDMRQLRCGRRELDEDRGHPFLFLDFQATTIKISKSDHALYDQAPYCPSGVLIGPDTMPAIRDRNRSYMHLPERLQLRNPRSGFLPGDYPR